jgi:DNA-binding CsgD family transcriptional regulator
MLLEEALAKAHEVRDTLLIANVLLNLALVALLREDHKRLKALIEESLALLQKAGDRQHVAECLEKMMAMAAAQEKSERAALLWGAAEALRKKINAPLPEDEHAILKPYLDRARDVLHDEGTWETALAKGREMTLKEAVEYALSEDQLAPPTSRATEQPSVSERPATLTSREREIAVLITRGLTNRQVSEELVISERTVANHVANILKKLGLHSREQVAASMSDRQPHQPDPH